MLHDLAIFTILNLMPRLDNNLNVNQNMKFIPYWIENIVGKEECAVKSWDHVMQMICLHLCFYEKTLTFLFHGHIHDSFKLETHTMKNDNPQNIFHTVMPFFQLEISTKKVNAANY